ncbi:MAG: hypothetical protein P8X39_01940 [Desulfofustis sp.]
MFNKLFPWKYLLKVAARRYDIIDPLSVAARIRSFAQPSEVQEPIELLRAGIVFHARGLLNTKAIQHNLDWVWPYWVERQFNPRDCSFIPRAFSFSHINLTHRNWTALGLPDIPSHPLVDPHGLITPLPDGWSVDCWFLDDEGRLLCPSRSRSVEQKLVDDSQRRIITRCESEMARVPTEAAVTLASGKTKLTVAASADATTGGWMIFALRPYNPEGIQFIEKAESLPGNGGWLVNGETPVIFTSAADKMLFSDYRSGDVSFKLYEPGSEVKRECSIGLVTAAAFHRIESGDSSSAEHGYSIELPFSVDFPDRKTSRTWPEAEKDAAHLQVPDKDIQFLYDAALRSLIHLSAGDTVPGPYTYNRFWFRDACIMLNALLTAGFDSRCKRHLDRFAKRQKSNGFFHSQDGEWDSNGQVLWLKNRYRLLSGSPCPEPWIKPILKGCRWIADKRVMKDADAKLKGLLPAGFSAEHFGPNDHYFWDDFWSVAGLFAAADMLDSCAHDKDAAAAREWAAEMEQDLLRSMAIVAEERDNIAIPTSPNRRLDSAAIGSIVADYPLQLFEPGDKRIMATANFLFNNCLQKGCFFQDMIHSGINIYMTLELAQVFLRAGDIRFRELLRGAVALASPTGQWPEAIHPITDGGCMGDGQHGWAVAEYIMLIRNMFVMEEADALIIGSGILPEWLEMKRPISFGPTLTPYGRVRVVINNENGSVTLKLFADWRHQPGTVTVRIPGYKQADLSASDYRCTLEEVA